MRIYSKTAFAVSLLFCLTVLLRLPTAAADAVITGTVTDEAGKPVRAAVITATIGGASVSRYSNAAGKFEIKGLKPGKYRVSATAWGYATKTADEELSDKTKDLSFSLAPRWNPSQISTAEYITAYGDDKDMRTIEASCTGCHNLSWILRRKGMTADEWAEFLPNMSPQDVFVFPRYSPERLKELSAILEKHFGPDSPAPTREQVKHVEVSDEVLGATFRSFKAPTRNYAHSLHIGADGKPWFTEFDNHANRVASFDLATQQFKEYEMPTPKAVPHNPWVSRSGHVWITESAPRKLARLDPKTGEIAEFQVPDGGGAHTLREGPTGEIWASGFTTTTRFDPRTNKFNVYKVGGYDIGVDSKNNAWTGDGPRGVIYRIDAKTGEITNYPVPGATFIRGVEVDAQDNVWFGDVMGHRLGRIDQKTGQMTFFTPPTANFSPYGIVIDKKTGIMWLADYLGANVTRFDPSTGKFVEYPLPSRTQMFRFFATDPQGRVWYTDFTNGSIGVLEPNDAALSTRR